MRNYVLLWALSFLIGGNLCQTYAADAPDNKKSVKKAAAKAAPMENAEAVYTYTVYGEIPVAKPVFEEDHFLGGELTKKWNTLNTNYTHVYDVSVGFSDSGTEIVKPAVYNAVLKVNKYYRKAVRKGMVGKDEAVKELSHIFDCANVICFEDNTRDFEEAVSQADGPEQLIALFNRVKLVRE